MTVLLGLSWRSAERGQDLVPGWTVWCFVDRDGSLASGCLSCAVILLLNLASKRVGGPGMSGVVCDRVL